MDAVKLPPELLEGLPPAVVEFIQAILAENAMLKARVAELEAKLNQNSTNSSLPPSSNPPKVKRAPPRFPSGKKQRGQPGHPKRQRKLVDRPDQIHECKPTSCRRCSNLLNGEDPEPLRHQVVELPPVTPIITEYRYPSGERRCCVGW